MNRFAFVLTSALIGGMGCYHRDTNRSPVGVDESRSYAAGLVMIHDRDTTIGQKDCEKAMTTFFQEEQQPIRREVYAPCFTIGMMVVDQQNQQPPPTPIDLNGDGRMDAVRYQSGVQVPYDLYLAFPGMYWPAEYAARGLVRAGSLQAPQPGIFQSGPYAPATGGYHSWFRYRGVAVGYPGDPATAGTPYQLATRQQVDQLEKDRDTLTRQTSLHREAIRRLRQATPTTEGESK